VPLDLFREPYERRLRRTVPDNLDRYAERKPWAGKATGPEPILLPSSLEPAAPLTLEPPDGKDKKDFENSVRVHAAFPTLTRRQARDPRLWVRLTHVECWEYMRKRWDDLGQHLATDRDKATRYVLAHYFVPQAQSRALLRNGVARLWWYAHLTHDPTRADPYELTRVLLSSLDIAQQVLERNMGRASRLRTEFLDFLLAHGNELGTSAGTRRKRIRDLAKALNLRGGVTLLDALLPGEVTAILVEEFTTGSAT
jgi:hypothetical protein